MPDANGIPLVIGQCAILQNDESRLPAVNVIGPFAQISFQFWYRTGAVDVEIGIVTIAVCLHQIVAVSHFPLF